MLTGASVGLCFAISYPSVKRGGSGVDWMDAYAC